MAGAGGQQQPLRCGDQVYLEISRGEATCRVHADVLKLGVTLNAGGDAGDFELDGRFAVYPAGRFAAQAEARARSRSTRRREGRGDEERRLARARAREEHAANERRVDAVAAGRDRAPLRYGDAAQLRHVATGCWLEERGAGDDGAGPRGGDAAAAGRLGLDDGARRAGHPRCVFELAPAFRSQHEGSSVLHGDEVALTSASGAVLGPGAGDDAALWPADRRGARRRRCRLAAAPALAVGPLALAGPRAFFHEERQRFLSADTRDALCREARRIFFDGARAPRDLRPQLRRTGADKDVDATGRELWLLEAAPPRAGAPAARGAARVRVRHVSSAQYLARGPGGAARLLPAPDGASCDLVLERVARDRGGAGAAADASFVLRHAATGAVFGERPRAAAADSDSDASDAAPASDDDAARADLGFRAGPATQADAFQVGAVSRRRGADARVARALRREFVAHGAAARGAAARSERAERSLGACIAWLLGRDAGDAPPDPGAAASLAGAPDRGRQALAREMGLVAALADVVRAPRDREARALGADARRSYLASHRLPPGARDLGAAIGPGVRAHRLAMRALQLCFAGNKANEFFFVEQEGGGWFLACIDQIACSVGAAEALSQLVSDNEELLERHIDARVCVETKHWFGWS